MPKYSQEQLAQFVKEFKAGNKEKFNQIYDGTWKPVYCTLIAKVHDENVARDLLQEIFTQVYRSLDNLKTDEAFLTWLNRLVQNKYVDYIRKAKKQSVVEYVEGYSDDLVETSRDVNPEDVVINKEAIKALHKIIASLPVNQRTAIKLFYFENLTTPEIAKKLNTAENVIRKRLFDGRKTIKAKAIELNLHKINLFSLGSLPILATILMDEILAGITSLETFSASIIDGVMQNVNAATLTTTNTTSVTNIASEVGKNVVKTTIKSVLSQQIVVATAIVTLTASGLAYKALVNEKNKTMATLPSTITAETPNNTLVYETNNQLKSETIDKQIKVLAPQKSEDIITTIITPTQKPQPTQKVEIVTTPSEISWASPIAPEPEKTFLSPEITTTQTEPESKTELSLDLTSEIPSQSPNQKPVEESPIPTISLKVKLSYDQNEKVSLLDFLADTSNACGNLFDKSAVIFEDFNSSINFSEKGEFITTIKTFNHQKDAFYLLTVNTSIGDFTAPLLNVETDNIEIPVNKEITQQQLLELIEANAIDNSDTKITVTIKDFEKISWDKAGDYLIYLSAMDKSGNMAKERAVIVTLSENQN